MAMGRIARERAILRAEDTGLPITIVSERLAFPRGVQSPPTECVCVLRAGETRRYNRGTILAVYTRPAPSPFLFSVCYAATSSQSTAKCIIPLVCVLLLLPLPVELNFIGPLSIRRRTESTSGPGNHGAGCPHGSRPRVLRPGVCLCAP